MSLKDFASTEDFYNSDMAHEMAIAYTSRQEQHPHLDVGEILHHLKILNKFYRQKLIASSDRTRLDNLIEHLTAIHSPPQNQPLSLQNLTVG